MKRLFEENERQKLQSAGLDITESSVLPVTYPEGVSPYDNRLPQESKLCGDLIKIGEKLVKNRYLSVCRTEEKIPGALSLPIFGYRVMVSSNPGEVLQRGAHRIWDFGTAEKLTDTVFGGLPFKAFNGYVPRFKDAYEASDARYTGAGDGEETGKDALKTFSYLACEDREELNGKFEGIVALAALKGDVDSLGKIFREGIAGENLAKMLAVSRSLHWFFSLYLPVLCRDEYSNIYTVYAGGDDFFFVGPWLSAQRFAEKIHEAFDAYAANPQVHFSAGLVIVKPACPPPTMARLAEEALKRSKLGAGAAKNAVTMYGVTIPWSQYAKVRELGEKLDFFSGYLDLSSSYLYSLFEIMALAARRNDPKASIWRSHLYYSTSRMLARKKADEAVSRDFLTFITQAVSEHSAAVRIPLSTLFYRRRNS
jgi:CRISPR-associated protein Csm1